MFLTSAQLVDKVFQDLGGFVVLNILPSMIEKQNRQESLEFVSIEQLVPSDHLLRKIDQTLDFSFISEKVKDLYCLDNGRPAVDPVILFTMLLIGYLFGIRSERQLIREIEVNLAYRWFLGYGLQDKIPHHSTISQNRRRRFAESQIYQEIFEEIVYRAIKHKMVDGKILYSDSTHLKANANKGKFKRRKVVRSTKEYIETLEKSVNQDRESRGKKAFKHKDKPQQQKEIKQSTTDPDSGYLVREGKPKGFFYLDHRTVDGKYNIITDTYATSGNLHDSIPYLSRLDYQIDHYGFRVKAVGLDAGYYTAAICKGLEDRNIYGVIGYNRPKGKKNYFRRRDYKYQQQKDIYICPAGKELKYRTTNRGGYREYISDRSICKQCDLLPKCTESKNHQKIISRHLWEDSKERIDKHRLEPMGKLIYSRRKETIERSFADAKQLHGHRYAKFRGINKLREQCYLSAAAQNIKKIALYLSRIGKTKEYLLIFYRMLNKWQQRLEISLFNFAIELI